MVSRWEAWACLSRPLDYYVTFRCTSCSQHVEKQERWLGIRWAAHIGGDQPVRPQSASVSTSGFVLHIVSST